MLASTGAGSSLRGRPTLEFPLLPLRGAGLGGLDHLVLTCVWAPGPLYGLGGMGGEAETSFGEEDRTSVSASCEWICGGVVCEGDV